MAVTELRYAPNTAGVLGYLPRIPEYAVPEAPKEIFTARVVLPDGGEVQVPVLSDGTVVMDYAAMTMLIEALGGEVHAK